MTHRMSEDGAILRELLQDIGGGRGRETKHSHPTLPWTISTHQCLTRGERERNVTIRDLKNHLKETCEGSVTYIIHSRHYENRVS